jgi:bacterioferritin
MSESAVAELNQHAADELRHATMIADRIIQLGGTPLLHPQDWLTQSGCGYKAADNFDVLSILNDSIKGEQCAIETYSSLSKLTEGKDIVTYNMVNTILADEVEHEEDLLLYTLFLPQFHTPLIHKRKFLNIYK